MTRHHVDIDDDPIVVSVTNTPGPPGASSLFKGLASAWPPDARPGVGWIWTLPDPLPTGTPAGFSPGDGTQWDGVRWTNIGPVRGPSAEAWPDLKGKPFETLGASLYVDGGVLNAVKPNIEDVFGLRDELDDRPTTDDMTTVVAGSFNMAVNRANHTGTQLATTISDFPPAVAAMVETSDLRREFDATKWQDNRVTLWAPDVQYNAPAPGEPWPLVSFGPASSHTGTYRLKKPHFSSTGNMPGSPGADNEFWCYIGPPPVRFVAGFNWSLLERVGVSVSVKYGTEGGTSCQGNDPRLSDARTPLDGSVTDAKVATAGLSASVIKSGTIDAARLPATTPEAHGSSHHWSGTDPIVIHADAIQQGTIAAARLGTGTPSAANYLRGDGTWQAVSGGSSTPVVVTPASLAADANDWAIGAGDIFRVAGTAARNVTGLAGGTGGRVILLVNVGTFAVTLKHASTSSVAANRFIVPWAGDCVLAANGGAVSVYYDGTSSAWRVL